jgi:hypothetical protein
LGGPRVRRAIARIRNQVAMGAMSVFACCLPPLPSMKDSRFISIQALRANQRMGREHRIGIEAVPDGREQERDQVEPGCTEQRPVQSQIHTRPPRPMRMLSSRRSRCVTAPPAQRVNDSRAAAT